MTTVTRAGELARDPVLLVSRLNASYKRRGLWLHTLKDVSLDIRAGEALGLVGESGCGKSTLAFAIMRYLGRNGRIDSGQITLGGVDLLSLNDERLREARGRDLAMVYQEPGSALNPSMRVGEQIAEVFRFQTGSSSREAQNRTREMLRTVLLPDPDGMMKRYPHQLSGGQQQRVVIAMALACNPKLLILDEPTTGLDASVEAEVLDLIGALRRDFDSAILFISHNLGLVARACERVGILYAGRLVEEGPAGQVFDTPAHPYTLGLLRCVPRLGLAKDSSRLEPIPGSLPALGSDVLGCSYAPRCPLARERCHTERPELLPVAEQRAAECFYSSEVSSIPLSVTPAMAPSGPTQDDHRPLLGLMRIRKAYGAVTACNDVTIEVGRGEIFGLVGESGSGKTTLARVAAGLAEADSGEVIFNGDPVARKVGKRRRTLQRALQMVFQSPDSTLNPAHSGRFVLQRAIDRLRGSRDVGDLASMVRMDVDQLGVRTTQLSGGQKQRVAIARAFAGSPELVLCDEPVSALDVSVQAAILNLLADLQVSQNVAYVFISHDLAVVRYLSDRIGVMYLGELFEVGSAEQVFAPPHHPYTEALVSAIPSLGPRGTRGRIRLTGEMPDPARPPSGCRFNTRCPRKLGVICEREAPPWQEAGPGHVLRCHISPTILQSLQHPTGGIEPSGAPTDTALTSDLGA